MFSRIHEALRILTYHEPETGPDAVIVERKETPAPRAGRAIANTIEIFMVAYLVGSLAGYIGSYLYKFVPHTRVASITTIVGALGFLLTIWGSRLRADIEAHLRAHLDLGNALAPFFGHKLTYASRVMKG